MIILVCIVYHRQESERRFTTFHDNKPLEPLVNERWEDFNVKVNTTLAAVLGKVCLLIYYSIGMRWSIRILCLYACVDWYVIRVTKSFHAVGIVH